jgi:hypothetical protein
VISKNLIKGSGIMAFTIGEVGGVVGLISGMLVFADRYYKGRPVVSLTTTVEAGQTLVCVRITNTTPYDIAVVGSNVKPPLYSLTENREIRTVLEGAKGRVPRFMLKPAESRLLIIKDNLPPEVTRPGRVDFWIKWHRGNATWLWQPPLAVCTSTEAIGLYRQPQQ